jgi:hypothetical protein
MYEYILAILTADEAVTLGIVKPLDCSLFHVGRNVPFKNLRWTEVGDTARQVTSWFARSCSKPIQIKRT